MSSLDGFLAARGVVVHRQCGRYNLSNRGAGKGGVKHIIQHYTGGTGSARNNCVYFGSGNRDASADFFIDPDGSIWQYNPDPDRWYSWAVGDGRGKYGITNVGSVSIEYVNTGGPFTDAQIAAGGALTRALMAYYGLNASRVVRHFDASRKRCPLYYVDPAKWNALHAMLTDSNGPALVVPPVGAPQPTASGAGLAVDGLLGHGTAKAVQTATHSPYTDGVFSRQPKANARYWPANTGMLSFSSTVRPPSDSMIALQRHIISKGSSVGSCGADGYGGKDTVMGLQSYLRNLGYGIAVDGYAGANTASALQDALNKGKF